MPHATPTDASTGPASNATASRPDRRLEVDGADRRGGADRTRPLERRRRRAVASYVAVAGATDVQELATYVTALEYDPTVESTRLEWRQRVYVSLRRTHLPQLADEGIVDYDDALATVRPGDRLSTVRSGDRLAGARFDGRLAGARSDDRLDVTEPPLVEGRFVTADR